MVLILHFLIRFGSAQTFSGKLDNIEHDELIFVELRDDFYSKRDTVYADDEGYFSVDLTLTTPGYIGLLGSNFSNEEIFLQPGENLYLSADCYDRETFWNSQKYQGDAALYNNFLADLYRDSTLNLHRLSYDSYRLSQPEFLQSVSRYYHVRDSLKKNYFRNVDVHTVGDFLLIDSIHHTYEKVSMFRSYMRFLPEEQWETFHRSFIAPYAIQKNDWHYLASYNYRWFHLANLNEIYEIEKRKEGKSAWWTSYHIDIPRRIGVFSSRPLQRYAANALLEGFSSQYRVAEDSLLKEYDESIELLYSLLTYKEVEDRYRSVFSEIRKFRNQIKPGEPALPFEVLDTLGNRYSLEDFKGKLLYVDLWAGWCQPCIAEFPAARALEQDYKDDKRIVFLSLSLDNVERDWRRALQKFTPPGNSYWIEKGFLSDFVHRYRVEGIPHYLIIDFKGNFVSYKAPRPSDGVIKEILDRELEKMNEQ